MNKYLKAFLHRGLMFGGFGPIILGIVLSIVDASVDNFYISGWQILLAVVTTYMLAFVQAGASVFNQIEHWPLPKSLAFHFTSIYLVYVLTYVANSWIPFESMVILVFTAIFVVTYFVIWITVYLAVKATEKRFNKGLQKHF